MALDPDDVALEQLRRELDDVDAALAQIDEGTYGLCQACGQPIGDARLAAHPATRACDEHSPACDEHSPPATSS